MKEPYRYRVVSRRPHVLRDSRYTYDERGRREYAGGLTWGEADRLLAQAPGSDVVVEEKIGVFEGMPLWKEVPCAR